MKGLDNVIGCVTMVDIYVGCLVAGPALICEFPHLSFVRAYGDTQTEVASLSFTIIQDA